MSPQFSRDEEVEKPEKKKISILKSIIDFNKNIRNKVNNLDKVSNLSMPYDERLRLYEEARQRIFEEKNIAAVKCISNKVKKARFRYKQRDSMRKMVVSALDRVELLDNRPHADVLIAGKPYSGLLDTGASISLLGKNCKEFIIGLENKIKKFYSVVRTASGQAQEIIGKISLPVVFKDSEKQIEFYLCPSLEKEVYLGIDFWRIFNIAPEIVGVAEMDIEKVQECFPKPTPVDKNMHDLTPDQHARLDAIKHSFRTFEEHGMGLTTLEKHQIQLVPDAVPVKDKHYPLSPAVQKLVYAEVDEMLRLGVIEESESPWSNRTTIVRKPGKNRFCLDARKLNARTIKDAYPLQNIDGILSRLDYTHFISSVDLKHAFWQIELEEEAKQYTAFTVPGRPLYQFRVMPFGLCNAAQRLCRLMDRVIPQSLKSHVFVYLDDLLIVAPDFDTHCRILAEVAECLRKANLTIGLSKSHFCFKELKYLGFVVGGGRLRTDPDKIEAISKIKVPRSAKEIRSFLGTAGWYRRFVKNFATLAAPISDCLKKKSTKFEITPEAVAAIENLKICLTTAPVLVHPDFSKRFFIQCDASANGVGAVLYQLDEENQERPIAFFSQKLNQCQKNYSVTKKECLAAVLAIKRFRPYVEMMPFTVVTDHASLKWLMNLRDLSGRLARWSLQLQAFDFEIVHCKGSDNVVADTLSRYVESIGVVPDTLCCIDESEFHSEEYVERLKVVAEKQESLPDLKIEDGKIFKRTFDENNLEFMEFTWKLWVPESATKLLVERAHDHHVAGHGGIGKTLQILRRMYYWPQMVVQVREYIRSCIICKESKPTNQNLMPTIGAEVRTERPFQKLYCDFLGKYPRSHSGHSYIFIVLDHFSKFVFLKAMKEATGSNVVKFLVHEIFHKFGVPETLHTDNGKQFIGKEFQKMTENNGINHLRTAVYSPQSNASERVNQSVLAAIRSYLDQDHRNWDLFLTEIECALRNSVHTATGVAPYFALFGQNMFTHGSDYKLARKLSMLSDPDVHILQKTERMQLLRDKLKENMHNTFEKRAKTYNVRARLVKFVPGQEVYKRNFVLSDFKNNINSKFCKKFIKCRVLRVVGNNMYELESLTGKSLGIFHAKDIKQ